MRLGSEPVAEAFRDVMAGVCTPVSVVTAMDGDRPHGTTVSAFTSLSLDPPMVLVALDCGSELLGLVRQTGRFGLNVLGSAQSDVATRFAGKGKAKFAGASWRLDHGLPRLTGVVGWLACGTDQLITGGDHIVALGGIIAAESRRVAPLTYHDRVFGTHTALEAACR
jgi:flavin reductase (DIM6/NTAB) family NADH-FMN oxidoreductase RutF